ncbi:MAG: F0F1 ATP synthase subunit B [Candidatus Moranbacteria bacterium]|jgi:F-type H+-transporting ATPase subunit b|nr:F0F1 ATP synthase subunit B [Candidatus Moranbacteria bacterium]MBP9801107.1 F0F1 ATP synthase subunit B [Candidatus Moranbacteria bacterium]
MEALANLGIDWKLLLAQVVNFVIVLLVLKRFAYQPMLKLLDERTAKIEKGLADAEHAGQKLSEIETKEKAVLAEARTEAKRILAETDEVAKKRDAAQMRETEMRVKKLLHESEVKIATDQKKMLEEAKHELAETVLLAVEKVLHEKMSAAKEKELIERHLN